MKILISFIAGVIALPVVLALLGLFGLLPSKAAADPPSIETKVMGRFLDASLERRSGGLTNPIAANDSGALAAGAKIYASHCSGCHGDSKGPSGLGTRALYPRVPQFFRGDASDLKPTEAFAAIHDGIRYSGMGAWSGQISDGDIWKVANYVAGVHGQSGERKD